ncbi:MAG: cell division protein FtsQ/DivIB [Fidelibacterota bacterium]
MAKRKNIMSLSPGKWKPRLQLAGRMMLRLMAGAAMAILIFVGFRWAHLTHQFEMVGVRIRGNHTLEKGEILQWIRLPSGPILTNIRVEDLQTRLEAHPYVKAARISRDFPSTLQIDVVERVPLAYINHSPVHLIDAEGVILPVRDQTFEFDIPTLSGFNPAEELYPEGKRCLSRKVLEAVDYLNLVQQHFPALYDDLSEVRINAGDEYVLYLTQYPTQIFLGAKELTRRLTLLHQFARTVHGIRSLHDYRYVDLRYKNQIVVRERG